MKVVASALQMSSAHVEFSQTETRERLRAWTGERPDFEGARRGLAGRGPSAPLPRIELSDEGRAKAAAESGSTDAADAIDAAEKAVDNDPNLKLLRSVIEWMTGRKMNIADLRKLMEEAPETPSLPALGAPPAGNSRAGFGVEYDYHRSHTEIESTRFTADGVVRTADGQEIRFSVSLAMDRVFHEETNISVRAGDAVRKDPLVINFGGNAAQLSDQTFRLDLDNDGQEDTAHFVGSGSGFLVFDRNGDGQVNNGSELFGPGSGNGFGELAALDDDGNGWIDEGDAAFGKLGLWTADGAGGTRLEALKAYDVGAIFTGSLATPFALKDGSNATLGEVKSSGVYLKESGGAGTVQQIDLMV